MSKRDKLEKIHKAMWALKRKIEQISRPWSHEKVIAKMKNEIKGHYEEMKNIIATMQKGKAYALSVRYGIK